METRRPTAPTTPGAIAFLVTFLAAWFALDRMVSTPPAVASSLLALAASGAVLLVSEHLVTRRPMAELLRQLGLGRPVARAVLAATVVGAAVIATFVAGAALLGTPLELRSNWFAVLVGVLLFHGLAEELVWRGYVYGHLRRNDSFGGAVARTVPLLALTHLPIIVGNGLAVGSLAVLSAAVTCLPLAYLYDRGGRTVWPPAIVHGAIGTWQLFDRTYPVEMSLLILCGSIVTPLTAFLFRDRFFGNTVTDRPPTNQPNQPKGTR